MKEQPVPERKTGLRGILVAITVLVVCCFGKLLLIALGVAGAGAFTPYFYYFLFPALAIILGLIYIASMKWKKLRSASGGNYGREDSHVI